MVFHLFERIFSPDNLKIDFQKDIKRLIAEGFTEEEARNISWIRGRLVDGKVIGLATGVFVLYTQGGWIERLGRTHIPRLQYQPWFRRTVTATVLFLSYKLGDYIWTSRRYGSDQKFTNHLDPIFSNRIFIENREQFVQNFEPLNRKFTEEEIESFLENDKNTRAKRWIYNPYVHGEDEAAFRARIEFLHTGNNGPWDLGTVRNKINEENQKKTERGEKLVYKPFQTLNFLDRTGLK